MLRLWNMFLEYIQISYPRLLWVFLFACVFYIVFYLISKKQSKKNIVFRAVLSMACSFVFVMTLFRQGRSGKSPCFTLFWSYLGAYQYNLTELWLQIIMNIAMYIPIGFSLPGYFQSLREFRKTVLLVFVVSVTIEMLQGVLRIGQLDVDDVLNNMIGTVLGYGLYRLYETCVAKFSKEKLSERECEKTY